MRGTTGSNAAGADGCSTACRPAVASTGVRLPTPISAGRLGGDDPTSPTATTTEVTTSCMPVMTSDAGAPTIGTAATTAVTVELRLSREVTTVLEIDRAAFRTDVAATDVGVEAAASGTEAAADGGGVAAAVGRIALR